MGTAIPHHSDSWRQYLSYIRRPSKAPSLPGPKFMPKLPPGPSFILRRLFSWEVASYSGFVYFLRIGTKKVGMKVPLWVIISSSAIALPVLFLAQCQFDLWKNQRKARSLGGRLVPTVPTKWPGGVDLMVAMVNAFKTGYIGVL
jgi:hypothetical protein